MLLFRVYLFRSKSNSFTCWIESLFQNYIYFMNNFTVNGPLLPIVHPLTTTSSHQLILFGSYQIERARCIHAKRIVKYTTVKETTREWKRAVIGEGEWEKAVIRIGSTNKEAVTRTNNDYIVWNKVKSDVEHQCCTYRHSMNMFSIIFYDQL